MGREYKDKSPCVERGCKSWQGRMCIAGGEYRIDHPRYGYGQHGRNLGPECCKFHPNAKLVKEPKIEDVV